MDNFLGALLHTRYARTLALCEVFSGAYMESAEAPPVADAARRFRGSAPIGGREQRTRIGWRNGDFFGKRISLYFAAERRNSTRFFDNLQKDRLLAVFLQVGEIILPLF